MRRGPALAALSGALLALSFPRFGHWAVAWVCLVPLLLALRGTTPAAGARLGYVTGVVSSLGLLYWTALVVVQYGGLSLPVGALLMVLLCLAVALFPALFGWIVARWFAAWGPRALLLAPIAWVATEILRAHTLYRFSWCLLGYSQQPVLPMIQIAAYSAVYGVSFVVACASAALAYAVSEPRPVPRKAALAGLAVLLALVASQGWLALATPLGASGRLVVGLVQAAILQDEKWDPGRAWENLGRHVELTREAAARGARLIVWPESSLPFLFDEHPEVAFQLRVLAREEGIHLFFGNDDRERAGQGRYWVGAKLLTPAGEVSLRYHKIRLVPFGEYVPMKPLLTLGGRHAAKLVQQVADFTPGEAPAVGRVDGYGIGGFICYEAIFPDLVRQFARGGADLLVNVTNDAWYGRSSAPHQHFAMAVFRAVENGKYLVRAANTGISAVVDPRGRVLERSGLFERTALVREVEMMPRGTFYTRHGDVFAWACFATAALLTMLSRRAPLSGR